MLRILVAVVLILIVAVVIIFSQALNSRTPDSLELSQIRSNCLKCHAAPPAYARITPLHNRHSALICSTCHNAEPALKTTDIVHAFLQWAGATAAALALLAVLANFAILNNRKGKLPT